MPLTNFDKQVFENNPISKVYDLEHLLSSNLRDNVKITDASDVMQNLGNGLPYQAGDTIVDLDGIHSQADLIDVKFWASIGVPSNTITDVRALLVSGTKLYVGGSFSKIGGIVANNIAQYDLVTGVWSNLGSPAALNDAVYAIAISGSTLYIGGHFTNANGNANADYIATCTTAGVWGAIGAASLNNDVLAIAVSGSNVYVGGLFTNADGIAAGDGIAKWNGAAWSALGAGLNSSVFCIVVYGTDFYIGGTFVDAGGVAAADYVTRWDGAAYNALGSGVNSGVYALLINNDDLYIGGNFTDGGGVTEADYAVIWSITNSSYRAIGNGGTFQDAVRAFAIVGIDLFVGGEFTSADGLANSGYIVKFDGANFNSIVTMNGFVYALAVYGTDLYLAGQFTTINARSSKGVAAYMKSLQSVVQYLEMAEQALQDGLDAMNYLSGWIPVLKTADQSKASDITLAADTHLQFAMLANTTYAIKMCVYGNAPATPDFKFDLSGPASPTVIIGEGHHVNPGGVIADLFFATYAASAFSVLGGGGNFVVDLQLTVQNGVNAGTFAFRWAQNISNATPTTVYAGSYIEYSIVRA